MALAVIALGGNLGDVPQTFERARTAVSLFATDNVRMSRLYRTDPVGAQAGDVFWNAALCCETSLPPLHLLDELQAIETQNGRTRTLHWGPRTLDLDLIFYGEHVLSTERLTLPHPHAWYRRFVLDPVADLTPELRHPVLDVTVSELRRRLLPRPLPIWLATREPVQHWLDEFSHEFTGVDWKIADSPCSLVAADGLGIDLTQEPLPLSPFWLAPRAGDDRFDFVRQVLRAAGQ